MGWTGVDQYDEANQLGQDFLDAYAKQYNGRRPEYCVTVVNRDVAATLRAGLHRRPSAVSPRGVKEALERIKMMPAAPARPEPACPSASGPVAPGWAPATWWPGLWTPTASTRTSSTVSEQDG